MPPITRGDLVYVIYQPGDMPNRLRAWPQAFDRNIIGKAPEGGALHVSRATTITSLVDGQRVSYSNPFRVLSDGVTWWYVRAFDGLPNAPRGKVIHAWTAENGQIGGRPKQFLEPLTPRTISCGDPGRPPLKSYLMAGKRAFVVTDRLELLRGPGMGYEVVGYLATGETLTVLDTPECASRRDQLWWRTDRNGWVCECESLNPGLRLNIVPLTV